MLPEIFKKRLKSRKSLQRGLVSDFWDSNTPNIEFLIKIIVSVHEMKCSIDFRHSTYSIEQIQERNLHQMQV